MTVVFDLDYTLLDTARFKKDLAAALEACGVSEDAFKEAYAKTVENGELIRDFDPMRYVGALRGVLTCSYEEALARIRALVENTRSYLFQDAEWVLESLSGDGHSLKLLTHGNKDWQEKKVVYSGIKDAFDEILFTSESKEAVKDALGAMVMPVVMINDNGKEIDALKEIFPDFHMIAVRGPKPAPSDTDVPVCKNFKEVYQEIKKLV